MSEQQKEGITTGGIYTVTEKMLQKIELNEGVLLDELRSRPHPAPARLVDQKAPICENCGLDSATCRMDMAGCLQAQNAAARKAREDVMKVIASGKSALYEIEPDGHWSPILQAKMDVLCWMEETLRAQQAGDP